MIVCWLRFALEQLSLGRVVDCHGGATEAHHGERRRNEAIAVLGRGGADAFPFAQIVEHGMLGGDPLLGLVEARGFRVRVAEGF